MKITKAEFVTSAAAKSQFIYGTKPVVAVCGKSNVGKSSFINALGNNNKLAKVSKEPGRTRLINYFDFGEFLLADLPGYGYARVSKQEKVKWANLLESFFAEKYCDHVFALCDIRHEPTADDKLMVEFLYNKFIPFNVIATKTDKISKAAQSRNKQVIATAFKCGIDNILAVSSQTKQGFQDVLNLIENLLEVYKK